MTLKEKIEKDLIGSYVAIDLEGGSSAKGKIVQVEDDFIILGSSGGGEILVALNKIVKVWQTL